MINRYIFVKYPEAKHFDDSDPSYIFPVYESSDIFVREDHYISKMTMVRILEGCNMDTIHRALERNKNGVDNESKKRKSQRKKTSKPST